MYHPFKLSLSFSSLQSISFLSYHILFAQILDIKVDFQRTHTRLLCGHDNNKQISQRISQTYVIKIIDEFSELILQMEQTTHLNGTWSGPSFRNTPPGACH